MRFHSCVDLLQCQAHRTSPLTNAVGTFMMLARCPNTSLALIKSELAKAAVVQAEGRTSKTSRGAYSHSVSAPEETVRAYGQETDCV